MVGRKCRTDRCWGIGGAQLGDAEGAGGAEGKFHFDKKKKEKVESQVKS